MSLDGWFPAWHDVTYCYQGIGWRVQDAQNTRTTIDGLNVPHTEMNLYKNTPLYARVMFTCFDSTGKAIEPPALEGSMLRTIRDRLLSLGQLAESDAEVKGPVFQVQVFAQSDKELHDDESQMLQQFLAHMRNQLAKGMLER